MGAWSGWAQGIVPVVPSAHFALNPLLQWDKRAMQDAFIHLFVNIILLALICMLRMNTVN
jgi:hypothetical protein